MSEHIARRPFRSGSVVCETEVPQNIPKTLDYENFLLRAKLSDLEQQIASLDAERNAVLASRSWRITHPLRLTVKLLRALARRRSAPGVMPAPQTARVSPAEPSSEGRRPSLVRARQTARQQPRLFVDVTVIADHDYRSGIQRVVRSILLEWLFTPPPGYALVPVRLDSILGYVPALEYVARLVGDVVGEDAAPIAPGPGDVFVGLDLLRDRAEAFEAQLQRMRSNGCRISIVLYDLLPLQIPSHFTADVVNEYKQWLIITTRSADRVLCISQSVADRYRAWIAADATGDVPKIAVFRLGSHDIPLRPRELHQPRPLSQRDAPTLLMVGTLEPRKRHDLALAAMTLLWDGGVEARLVIVGHLGWGVASVVRSIRQHAEFQHRLFWHEGVTDLGLGQHYRDADALLACSDDEGFGLPVAEACVRGLPLILRRLSVFEEVAGADASYFDARDAESLARHLGAWIHAWRKGEESPSKCRDNSWTTSAGQLAAMV